VRLLAVASLAFFLAEGSVIQGWMEEAFYPVLLAVLVLASLGLPIPEDIPLIAAGVLLHEEPGIASWPGTLLVALLGVMIGDIVLYRLGWSWGPDVVGHRLVRRVLTPERFEKATAQFHKYGMWFCFGGRFLMGVRAGMCLTAGATRFRWWRFLLADLAGAILSVPFFVFLGFWSAGMIPHLRRYVVGVEWALLAVVAVIVGVVVFYRRRRARLRRAARADLQRKREARLRGGPVATDADP
jgi:membrane protein DedA with SNARE-associated domain